MNDSEIKKTARELVHSRIEGAEVVGESILAKGSRARPRLENLISSPSADSQAWAVYGILLLDGLDAAKPSKWISKRTAKAALTRTERWTANALGALVAIISLGLAVYIALSAVVDRDFFFLAMLIGAVGIIFLVLISAALNIAQRIIGELREERRSADLQRINRAVEQARGDGHNMDSGLLEYRDRPELIETALRSYSYREQRAAVDFLTALGVRRDVERLAVARGSRSSRVRNIRLLGWFAGEESLPLLVQLTGFRDVGIVFAAADALSRYDNESAYRVLFQMLRDERLPRSRVTDFLRFSLFRDKVLLDAERVEEEDPKIRFRIAYLLGKTNDERALPGLYRLCDDKSDEVAANAVESLGELKDISAVPIVQRLLFHPSWLVRSHAAKAAKMLKDARLIPPVARLLRDDQWWVRKNAAGALTRIGEPAVPELVKYLGDPDRFAKNKSAEILGRIGVVRRQIHNLEAGGLKQAEARKFLTALGRAEGDSIVENYLLEAKPGLQRRISEVLGDIGSPGAVPFLKRVRDETEFTDVREATENAINKIKEAV